MRELRHIVLHVCINHAYQLQHTSSSTEHTDDLYIYIYIVRSRTGTMIKPILIILDGLHISSEPKREIKTTQLDKNHKNPPSVVPNAPKYPVSPKYTKLNSSLAALRSQQRCEERLPTLCVQWRQAVRQPLNLDARKRVIFHEMKRNRFGGYAPEQHWRQKKPQLRKIGQKGFSCSSACFYSPLSHVGSVLHGLLILSISVEEGATNSL